MLWKYNHWSVHQYNACQSINKLPRKKTKTKRKNQNLNKTLDKEKKDEIISSETESKVMVKKTERNNVCNNAHEKLLDMRIWFKWKWKKIYSLKTLNVFKIVSWSIFLPVPATNVFFMICVFIYLITAPIKKMPPPIHSKNFMPIIN